MTLFEFQFLSDQDKHAVTENEGICVDEKKVDNYSYKTYRLNGFFVQEKWHIQFNECRARKTSVSLNDLIQVNQLPTP